MPRVPVRSRQTTGRLAGMRGGTLSSGRTAPGSSSGNASDGAADASGRARHETGGVAFGRSSSARRLASFALPASCDTETVAPGAGSSFISARKREGSCV